MAVPTSWPGDYVFLLTGLPTVVLNAEADKGGGGGGGGGGGEGFGGCNPPFHIRYLPLFC